MVDGQLDFDWTVLQSRLPSLVLGISTTPYQIETVAEYLPSGLVRHLAARILQADEVSRAAGVATLSVEQPGDDSGKENWWIPLAAAAGAAGCSLFVIGALWRRKNEKDCDEYEKDCDVTSS